MFAPSALLSRASVLAVVLAAVSPTVLWPAEPTVAVFAQTYDGYARTQQPDGAFKPETYAFGEGGTWGLDEPAPGKEKLTFMRVARAAAKPLARAHYLPTPKPDETDLLILVYWGRTLGSRGAVHSFAGSPQVGYTPAPVGKSGMGQSANAASQGGLAKASGSLFDPSAAAQDALIEQSLESDRLRDPIDRENARILGYSDALQRAQVYFYRTTSSDVRAEVEANRYYVVLHAYDFRTAWKEKQLKPRWTARISIDEDEGEFDAALERMLATASRFFGGNSGLHRDAPREGKIDLGPLKVIETLPEK
jgi:hypothetical protein